MAKKFRGWWALPAVGFALLLAGCDDFGVFAELDRVGELRLEPSRVTLGVNNAWLFAAVGGNPPYAYTAASGTIVAATGEYRAPAAAGSDLVEVHDAQGRVTAAEITVLDSFRLLPGQLSVAVNAVARFSAAGGQPPYSYELAGGEGAIEPQTGDYTAPPDPGEDLVRARDALGNTAYATVSVTPPQALLIAPASVTLAVGESCTFSAGGGVSPYLFSVPYGGGAVDGDSGLYTAPALPGPVVVRVTDQLGVTSDGLVTVVDASGPLAIAPQEATVAEGGSLQFTASGGRPPYRFSLAAGPGAVQGESGLYLPDPDRVGEAATVRLADSALPWPAAVETQVTAVPAAPSNLQVDGDFGGSQDIRVTWSDNSGCEEAYCLERRTGSSGPFVEIADDLPPGTGEYEDGGLSPFMTYSYRVRARKGALYSAYSEVGFDHPN